MGTRSIDEAAVARPPSAKFIRQLPLEVWVLVIGHLVDSINICHVWVKCRMVCKSIRRAAELAFKIEALQYMQVNLSLMGSIGHNYEEVARLKLKTYSQDGARAHFEVANGCRIHYDNELEVNTRLGDVHSSKERGNLPILIEWTERLYISVCRGPTSLYTWSDNLKHQLCHVWLAPNSEKTIEMVVHHGKHEVSFLWQPLLEVFLKKKSRVVAYLGT